MYGRGCEGWSWQRLPGHVQWPWHLAQEDCHARQETHTPVLDVESISTVVPLLLGASANTKSDLAFRIWELTLLRCCLNASHAAGSRDRLYSRNKRCFPDHLLYILRQPRPINHLPGPILSSGHSLVGFMQILEHWRSHCLRYNFSVTFQRHTSVNG